MNTKITRRSVIAGAAAGVASAATLAVPALAADATASAAAPLEVKYDLDLLVVGGASPALPPPSRQSTSAWTPSAFSSLTR